VSGPRDRFVNRDQDYLRDVQYATGDRLDARTQLHAKYSTAAVPFFVWLQGLLDLPTNGDVLEVGCGTGLFWTEGRRHDANDFTLTLTDLSPGMVEETSRKVSGLVAQVHALPVDVQALPFADETFDVVIANQMLYHVPDPPTAIRELARVLRRDGVLLASTVGAAHLRELFVIEATVFGATRKLRHHDVFGAESGLELLRQDFADVAWHPYVDELHCTEVDDVISYIVSTPPGEDASPEQITALRREVERRMARSGGVLTIGKNVGAFVARP
jgi:SAM-dependent methyltransferase